MWPFQNNVTILGWIERIYQSDDPDDFGFRVIQPGYHEHFSSASKDHERLLGIDVWAMGPKLSEQCREYLRVGHRVSIFGRLIPIESPPAGPRIAIEALNIERSEALESFRYVNHVWGYELKPPPELVSLTALPKSSFAQEAMESSVMK